MESCNTAWRVFDFNPASSNLKLKSQHSVARLGAKENKCNRKTCSRMTDSSQFIQPTLDPEPKALQGHERSWNPLFNRRHCGHGFSTAASNGAKLKKIEEFVSPQMFCSDFIPGHIWVVRLHPMVWNILNHCNLDALRNRLSTLALSKRSDSCWAISWVAVAAVHGKVDQDESSQELLLKGTNVRHGESQEDIKESYQEQTLCMLRHFRAEFICWGADNNARNLAEQRYDTAKRTIYIQSI